MGLLKGKSSFRKEEMQSGEPKSLAIAFHMKRKMAKGGMAEDCEHGGPEMCAEGCYAEGGQVDPPDNPIKDESEDDQNAMVMRVMSRKKMSKGGMVANEDLPEADFLPNEFDDLHLRDELEGGYTGANSGDELSSDGEDERRRDMVRRIMASRGKRPGRNPSPA